MTIYGSTGGFRNGLTGLQEWTRIDNEIRDLNGGFGMQIRRSYMSNLPATFASTEGQADVGKRITSLTFTTPTWGTVANGSRNSDITDFCDSVPAGHFCYLGYFHEPEDQVEDHGWDPAEWREAQAQFIQSVLAAGNPKVIPSISLMSWTGNLKSSRDPSMYDPGPLLTQAEQNSTVMGQDGYATEPTYTPAGTFDGFVSQYRALGWPRQGIWETGVEDFSTRSLFFSRLEQYCRDVDMEVVTYFHSDTNPDPTTDCWLDLETYDHTALDTWAAVVAGNQDITVPPPDPEDPDQPVDPPEPGQETRVSNSITVYPQYDPDGDFIGGGSIGEDDVTETGTDWYITVRDFFEPSTVYAKLFSFQEFSFTKALNDTGFGELVISRDDPFVQIEFDEEPEDDLEGKGILTFPLLFSFIQNGAERFRMVYDGKNKDRARTDAAEAITLSGTGLGAMLAWGVVLPKEWPQQTKSRARKNDDAVWANLFVSLFHEAKDRGEIPDWMELGFDRERDSYGHRWETLGDREIEIGSSLLDVITTAADAEEFDWIVTHKGTVHAAPILGADLTKTIRFFTGVTNNEVGATEDRKDLRTVAYVEGTAGRISKIVSDRGTERWGRRAIYLSSEEAKSERQRIRVGHGTLRVTKHPTRERFVTVPLRHVDVETGDDLGRTAFIDYSVGDLVGLGPRIHPDTLVPASSRDVRVREIGVRVSPDGEPEVELGLEHRLERFAERVRRLLQLRFGQWSSAKAARQGKVPIANLRDTDAEFPNAGDTLVHDPDADDGDGLWKNGKAGIPLVWGLKGPLRVITDDDQMDLPVDGIRRLLRVTAQLRHPSTAGHVELRLKRNDNGVDTLNIPEGENRARHNVSIPVTEDDTLSLVVVDAGSGASNLQYVVETGI